MFAAAQLNEDQHCAVELAESVVAIVSELRRALDLGAQDLEGAQRRVDAVNRQLLRMIVGAPASPSADRLGQIEFGSGRDASFTQMPWWSRLIFRHSSVAGWAHY